MPIGWIPTIDTVNDGAGQVAIRMASSFQDVHDVHNWLTSQPDADMLALGFSAPALAALRAAYEDLFVLWEMQQGVTTADARQGDVYDFRTTSTPLTGGFVRSPGTSINAPTAGGVTNTAGTAYFRLQSAMIDAHDFRQWLHQSMSDPDLTALGFASGDITDLRAAFEDLFVLYQIWHGDTSGDSRQGTIYDFRSLATALTGGQIRN